jgi:hypothetical protein
MSTTTEQGVLILADISGFTAFVTATELEHGPPIIAELLEEVMRQLAPPLEIQEVEGDAVFALGGDRVLVPPARLLDVLERAVVAFRTRRREIQAVARSCACNACQNVSILELKIVAHHGRFLRQVVGGRGQVAGADVILAHRLLKNGWAGTRTYLLLTEAALRWIGLDPARDDLASHTEHYEHLGEIRCFVRDLGAAPPTPERSARAVLLETSAA